MEATPVNELVSTGTETTPEASPALPVEALSSELSGRASAAEVGRPCPTCAATAAADDEPEGPDAYSYVYAIGQIESRFPTQSLEKEFAQATGRAETAGLTDRQALSSVLSEPDNQYLARRMCYVLTVGGLDTYVLYPRYTTDFSVLVDALQTSAETGGTAVVVGVRGGMAPPEACNGLEIPVVAFDQLYSFDVDAFTSAMPAPEGLTAEQFEPTANELLSRVLRSTNNAGNTPEDRAVNYLAVRYPAIYQRTAEAYANNASLNSVQVRPSRLTGIRQVVDVIFSYTNRETDDTERYAATVDVTEEFPFLVSKLSTFYEVSL
jgi:PatG C-terminal